MINRSNASRVYSLVFSRQFRAGGRRSPRWKTLLQLERGLCDASHAARADGLEGLAAKYWSRVEVIRDLRRRGLGRR